MNIKRLYIGDFGVFKNQTLDNLSPGIVVIGGLNRAGKSTFLEVLRCLGYGIQKGGKLPKPAAEYMVESDVTDKQGNKFNIRLQGYREPKVTELKTNREAASRDLYGNIDYYTYSQLFTITLDELQKVNLKQGEKLQTILMGAGFKEIIQIPSITANLKKESEKIGGKNGSVNIKQFKPYNQKIVDNIRVKLDENRKVTLYNEKIKALEATEGSIICLSEDLDKWESKLVLLDIIKSSIEKYKIKIQLETEAYELEKFNMPELNRIDGMYTAERLETIKDNYYKVLRSYNEAVYYFKTNIAENLETAGILENIKDKVFNYGNRLPSIKEKLQRYMSLKELYEEEKNEIVRECSLLNEDFNGNLNSVLNIKCDNLSQDRLLMLSVEYNSLNTEISQLDRGIEDLNLKRTALEKQADIINMKNSGAFIKKYLYISLGIAFIGILISIINKAAGFSISFAGIACTAIYTVVTYISNISNEEKNKELLTELRELNILVENKSLRLSSLDDEFDRVNEEIRYYTQQLQLKEDISMEGLRDYLKNIKDLKKRIIILSQRAKTLGMLKEEVILEFKSISDIVLNLQYLKGMEFASLLFKGERENIMNVSYKELNISDKSFIELQQYFLSDIEKIIIDCNFLGKYEAILDEKQNIEKSIENILNIKTHEENIADKLDNFIFNYTMYEKYKEVEQRLKSVTREIIQNFSTDRARGALKSYYNYIEDNCDVNSFINNIYNDIASVDMLQRDYEAAQLKVEELRLKLESEKDKRIYIREEIKRLSTVEKLQNAQRQIDKARSDLKVLAERYAVYNAAAFILEQVQKNFIENAKDSMLHGASEMFKEITNGEYVNISPSEDISSYDYAVTLEDENIQPSMDLLSRGTAEQLFLSVRLSRIKDITPPLPIILDDPFVNFDSPHVEKVMKILVEMSKTNQIFILTCHPQMIREVKSQDSRVQYFKLDRGKFSSSDANNLIEYLSNKY